MWMDKLFAGVLRVLTPLGPRYLRPSLPQRIYLLWLFRNFPTLPVKVLSPRQQKHIEAMCSRQGFSSLHGDLIDLPVLGTLEERPPVEAASVRSRQPRGSVNDGAASFADQ